MHTICGRTPKGVKAAAQTLGWKKVSTDWREVVADPEIDIIDVSTPTDSHHPITMAAIAAGKAVLCEKPLAMNVKECEQIVAAAKKAHTVNMVCHNYRRIPAMALAREMIRRGDLGDRIYHFQARFAYGRKNHITIEINGSKGSLAFDFEDMNRLKFYSAEDPEGMCGFRDILVTESSHPYINAWWPPGHIIGYEHTFINAFADFIQAVATGKSVQPTFEDGLANEKVLSAIVKSASQKKWVKVY